MQLLRWWIISIDQRNSMNTDNHNKTECEFKELTQMKSLVLKTARLDYCINSYKVRKIEKKNPTEIICKVSTAVIY